MNTQTRVLYDIRIDRNLQKILRETRRLGLETKIAKVFPDYGSNEWWDVISEKNQIEVLTGVITRVFISGHGDFPEFELESSGKSYRFERKGDEGDYQIGDNLRLHVAARSSIFEDRELEGLVILRVEKIVK